MFLQKSKPRKNRLLRVFAVLCSFMMLLSILPTAVQADNNKKSRSISVVYDDSGSMIKESTIPLVFTDRWCQAKYAMEVFASMLDTEDVMNIFPMSTSSAKKPYLTIRGSESAEQRVSSIHNMITDYGNTPYETVTNAYKYLASQTADEKWLIVLTDGNFEDGDKPISEINDDMRKFASEGAKIVYLTMSSSVEAITEDRANNIFYYNAGQSSEILSKLTEIANLIFERQLLDDKYITKQDGSVVLNLDVPMENLFIFAQGKQITVGDITGGPSAVNALSKVNVQYSDKYDPYYDQYGVEIPIADNLSGVVAEYQGNATGNLIEQGQYTLAISDASNLQVYYKMAVDVEIQLSLEGVPVDPTEHVEEGNYTGKVILRNPINGEELQSELLKNLTYQVEVINGTNQQTFKEQEFKIPLEEGTLQITADVWLNGDTTVKQTLESTVIVPINQFSLRCGSSGAPFMLDELPEKGRGITLIATEGGQPLSEDIWKSMTPEITTSCDVDFEIVPGEDVSTWIIYPLWKDGDIRATQTGEITFEVTATLMRDGLEAEGKAQSNFQIQAEILPMSVTFEVPADPFDVHTLEDGTETRYIVADVLLNGEAFTAEDWELVEIAVTSEQNINFRVEKGTGENISKVFIYPELFESKEKTSEGLIQFQLQASFNRQGTLCEGIGYSEFQMLGLTIGEKIIKYIVMALIFLFILGYAPFGNPFGKSYLTKKNIHPYYTWTRKSAVGGTKKGQSYTKCTISKWMYLIPYKNLEASIVTRMAGPGNAHFPNLEIKAVRGGAYLIKNLKAMADKGVKLNGIAIMLKPKEKSRTVSRTATFTFTDNASTNHTLHFK